MNKKFYVTTPIYYPSGNLHIGHAYTTILADTIARYKRAQGYDVYFLTGSDEHGQKIEQKAKEQGIDTFKFLDEKVENFKKLWSLLDISHNDFIRTTNKNHMSSVQQIFSRLLKKGKIYKDFYDGKYCIPCESNWQLSQIEIINGQYLCPDCNRSLQNIKEESYFLKLAENQDFIKKLFKTNFLIPERNVSELKSKFVDPGLKDLSISRTTFTWGVPVKEDAKHVIYVWIDALPNYITALGYGTDNTKLFDKFWTNDTEILHIVGKEIVRFHGIYWPIILKYLDIFPKNIKVMGHGWITSEGQKMSKSIGNIINPLKLIDKYGAEHLRYYLMKEILTTHDGDFTYDRFFNAYNTDLVNKYGNLVSRTHSMISKYFNGIIPDYQESKTALDKKFESDIINHYKDYQIKMNKYKISDAIKIAISLAECANTYISDTTPWQLAKDEDNIDKLKSILNKLVKAIEVVTFMLEPIINKTVPLAFKQYGIEKPDYKNILNFKKNDCVKLNEKQNLFPRLEKEWLTFNYKSPIIT